MKTKKSIYLMVAFAVLVGVAMSACDEGDDNFAGIIVNENIEKATTWTADNVYIIENMVSVNANLTIEAGTVIKFKNDAGIRIGWETESVKFTAIGTPDKPIVFTSAAASPSTGDWKGLWFYSKTASSTQLAFCKIEYAGQIDEHAIYLENAEITMNNCALSRGKAHAIEMNDNSKFIEFKRNFITDFSNHPIVLSANAAGSIDSSNAIATNGNYGVLIKASNLTNNATWLKLTVPYVIEEQCLVDAELTIEAGATVLFKPDALMRFGWNSESAKLTAIGTATKPIIFSSASTSPSAGDWMGLWFYSKTAKSTQMSFCKIEYAGQSDNQHAIYLENTDIKISDCTISKGEKYAIVLNANSKFTEFKRNSITEFADHPIVLSSNAASSIDASNSIVAVAKRGVLINGSELDVKSTWHKLTVPYIIEDNCNVNAELTLEAGTTILFKPEAIMRFGWGSESAKLTAIGTATDRITFSSASSSPSAGDWQGLRFYSRTMAGTKLSRCNIEYANEAIYVESCGANVAIDNSTIKYSGTSNITYSGSGAPVVINVVDENGVAVVAVEI